MAPESAAVNIAQTAEVNEWSDCPYIDPGWLENTNGERLTKQGIDTRFPTPACVFWSYQDEPQATVIVRDMPTVDDARAAVDWAAPIDATEPASFDGWEAPEGGPRIQGSDSAPPELAYRGDPVGPARYQWQGPERRGALPRPR